MSGDDTAGSRTSSETLKRRYFWLLLFLLLLFCLRVLGQALVAFFGATFLPPMEEWFSGVLPYPGLLSCQILIIFLYGKVCLDFFRGHGYFVIPRPRLGIILLRFGALYLGVMLIRYAIRMGLYPHERWTGGSIPIYFHWVLASFLLGLGSYHWRAATRAPTARTGTRRLQWTFATLVGLGIVAWIAYQVAPSVLARRLGFRRSEFAVRVTNRAAMITSDGTSLLADIYHPQHTSRTPTILVCVPLTRSLENSLFASIIGRMWAERGYTVIIQKTPGRFGSNGRFYPLRDERQDGIETLAWIQKQAWFNGHVLTCGGPAFGHTDWAIAGCPTSSQLSNEWAPRPEHPTLSHDRRPTRSLTMTCAAGW